MSGVYDQGAKSEARQVVELAGNGIKWIFIAIGASHLLDLVITFI